MATKFTPAQQQAIDATAENILVSAAAGSGKTAVLTQRIVRHIADGQNIDDLLIVTFTEAASAEMRERIEKNLQNLHDINGPDQVARLPLANISTIHSFCRKLVQENFQSVDIDPAFRVGDMTELSLIRKEVMDAVFESAYMAEDNQDFLDLVDVYGGKSTDGRLDVLVQKIHDFMASAAFPIHRADSYSRFFDLENMDLGQTPWAEIAREELAIGVAGAIEGLKQALSICHAAMGPYKYAQRIEEDMDALEDLQSIIATHQSFADMYEAFTYFTWGNLPTISAKDEDVDGELKEMVQNIRNKGVKDPFKAMVKGVFLAPLDKMHMDLVKLEARVKALMGITIKFSTAFGEEKRSRNILDFTDLEHFAIKILYPHGPEDLTPNPDIHQFYEVLIDEYQDSNEVQDLILSAVAQRRFMVGDVKQSIYRFRRADPSIFMAKYKKYANGQGGQRIDLSDNFRSRPEVLDGVNFIFTQLMCEKVGDVSYDHAAALHPGHGSYPPVSTAEMRVEILDQFQEVPDTEDEEEVETPDNIVAETRMIAGVIKEVLQTHQVWDDKQNTHRPATLDDIAVITRSANAAAGAMIEEFKSHNIDAIADMDAGFLEQIEVVTALSFLRIIDNPRQDFALITVLYSPVYAITEDELVAIKSQPLPAEGEGLFYDHVQVYYQAHVNDTAPLQQKLHKFFTHLQAWKEAAVNLPISRLIGLVYTHTNYPGYVMDMPGGSIRQGNLRLLLERAMEFEETSLTGLFQFINYINTLYETGVKFIGANEEPMPNPAGRLRIMTIHKSKGLEFPIVICAMLGKQFNKDSLKDPVIMHPELGVGPYYVDQNLRTKSNTLARFSLGRKLDREGMSEEMRCLYVALTRAKELLILTGRCKNFEKDLKKWANVVATPQENLPAYYRLRAKSYLDWVMPAVLRHKTAQKLTTGIEVAKTLWDHPAAFKVSINKQSGLKSGHHSQDIIADQPHTPDLHLTPHDDFDKTQALPSKISITEIRRMYESTPDSANYTEEEIMFNPPGFLQNTQPGAREIGTAMHTVVEHLDYRHCHNMEDIHQLIDDLVTKNLLTPGEVDLIDKNKIHALIRSPLATRMRNASKIYRENPFILSVDASTLYPQNPTAGTERNERILVHGIIDCYFEENGHIILVDYKSDHNPQKHLIQLKIYKQALENATGMPVHQVIVYSFGLGAAVALPEALQPLNASNN